jgi:hypothetical protein
MVESGCERRRHVLLLRTFTHHLGHLIVDYIEAPRLLIQSYLRYCFLHYPHATTGDVISLDELDRGPCNPEMAPSHSTTFGLGIPMFAHVRNYFLAYLST